MHDVQLFAHGERQVALLGRVNKVDDRTAAPVPEVNCATVIAKRVDLSVSDVLELYVSAQVPWSQVEFVQQVHPCHALLCSSVRDG